jgi:hypothetical protein
VGPKTIGIMGYPVRKKKAPLRGGTAGGFGNPFRHPGFKVLKDLFHLRLPLS